MCFSWRQHKYAQCSGSMIIRAKLAIEFRIVANRNITEPRDSGFLFPNDSKDTGILFYLRRHLAEVPVQELNQWQLHSFSGLTIRSYLDRLLFSGLSGVFFLCANSHLYKSDVCSKFQWIKVCCWERKCFSVSHVLSQHGMVSFILFLKIYIFFFKFWHLQRKQEFAFFSGPSVSARYRSPERVRAQTSIAGSWGSWRWRRLSQDYSAHEKQRTPG